MESENYELTATNNWSGLAPVKDYSEYKTILDQELRANAEGFVRIGYLLKVARDTNILYESGYKSVAEFAKAEYGLTKDIVSRYIAINDRYSENGYSDTLALEYSQYGATKLAEMLTLSDEMIGALDPSMTRKEIQDIKAEIKEEEKITDLEVMIEEKPEEIKELTFTQQVIAEYFRNEKDKWIAVRAAEPEQIMNVMSPSEFTFLWARVPGTGKIAITISMANKSVKYVNVRTNEATEQSFESFVADYEAVYFGIPATEQGYNDYYHIIPEEKPEEKTGPVPVPNYRDILPDTKAKTIENPTDWLSGYHEGDRVVFSNPNTLEKMTGKLAAKTDTMRSWIFTPDDSTEKIWVREEDIAYVARESEEHKEAAAEIKEVAPVQPLANNPEEAIVDECVEMPKTENAENAEKAAEIIETTTEEITESEDNSKEEEKREHMHSIVRLIEGFKNIDTNYSLPNSILQAIRDRAELLIEEIDDYRRVE